MTINCLEAYSESILHCINFLEITSFSQDFLVQVIPSMKNLEELSIDIADDDHSEVLQTISLSNVTSLTLKCGVSGRCMNQGFLNYLADLISAASGKLKQLTITNTNEFYDIKPLCKILFGQSCLNHLSLSQLDGISGDCFSLLQTNTSLTSVHLIGCGVQVVFQTFSKILQSNKTLQKICLDTTEYWSFDLEQVEKFNAALATNTTLKKFILYIWYKDQAQVDKLLSLIPDARLTIKH